MNDLEKGWVAGIIDGEGTILINREKKRDFHSWYYGLQVCVTNMDKRIIDKLKKICGGYIILVNRKWEYRPYYRWYIKNKNAMNLLLELDNLIISKQKEIKLAIEFQSKKKLGVPKGSWGRPTFQSKEQKYFENCHKEMKAIRKRKIAEERLAQGVL